MMAFGVTPAGDTIPLIDIEHWDFHWQGSHSFQKPLKIPAGTVLHGIAHYDNTYNNPESPRPIADVSLGEATTNEMMLFFFSYLNYQTGDENIIVDTAMHDAHYLGCVSPYVSAVSTGIHDLSNSASLHVYPNPVQHTLNYVSSEEITEVMISDISGKVVKMISTDAKQGQIEVGDMADGLYFIRLQAANGGVRTLRFTKD
jgi:hypothetical protein